MVTVRNSYFNSSQCSQSECPQPMLLFHIGNAKYKIIIKKDYGLKILFLSIRMHHCSSIR